MTFIDLSHTVEHGMVTYPGLPAPLICDFLSREASREFYTDGVEFHIGKIEMVANTGTYLDSPFHRYSDGKDLSELPLDSIAGVRAICVAMEELATAEVSGRAVLVKTGWSDHWGTATYLSGHPFLTLGMARDLRDRGAKLVGIDSLNIDDMADKSRPVHSTLLGAEIPIVEHLTNLAALPREGFRFFAVPPKVKAMGTFPVRAFAVLG